MPFYFDPGLFDEVYGDQAYYGKSPSVEDLVNFPEIPFGSVSLSIHVQPENYPTHVRFAGRRNRVLAGLARWHYNLKEKVHEHWFSDGWGEQPHGTAVITASERLTFATVLAALTELDDDTHMRQYLSEMPLRRGEDRKITSIPESVPARDPDLHYALHDLSLTLRDDLVKAIDAAHGNGWFPGVDEGIEPVPDEHVELVIWGYQRELDRERRGGADGKLLPAYPLSTLPWVIQRAIAERRRKHYQDWGIGRKQWEEGVWSVWDVPDDDWWPEWNGERE